MIPWRSLKWSHDQEVSREELDLPMVKDNRPTWEAFSSPSAEKTRLLAERQEILELQEKVVAAREQVSEGQISEPDLDADLLGAMLPAVGAHVPTCQRRHTRRT